ncbi:matrixin family metalloprotease [Lentilactobacillus sp. SPB1-3]|uniref:Matrixin family metalloprotease n=1 Tax=Lentilactobacillus terminaliae TaxID=3003483 RepID=A0ACD5DEQ6_9LACO|nr:matrixin family metalloprotease [Lentilactobacillus sp. SPB1-3]MCZ0976382.1 matrixin family metalloprotease [Lentilactobacillus sp. SPB1-3]
MVKFKKQLLGLATAIFAFGSVFTAGIGNESQSAEANTKSAKVVKVQNFSTRQYRATKGYIYRTTTLNKKIHNAKNYPKTVFYTSRQVTVKKTNGKKAVYFYVQNKTKKVKGYIWRGYLVQIRKISSDKTPTENNNDLSSTSSTAEPIISASALDELINKAPDLDPSSAILNLNAREYGTYRNILDKAYNIIQTSPASMFENNTASIYVTNNRLVPYVQQAISKWNNVLNETVFTMGTKGNHTLTVNLVSDDDSGWDGMYDGKAVYVEATRFLNSHYPNAYLDPQAASLVNPNTYWVGVITHELGHTLGLDHTGYQSDLMFASSSKGSAIAKYDWQSPVELSSTGLDGAESGGNFTSRDIDRAKLAKNLGYW